VSVDADGIADIAAQVWASMLERELVRALASGAERRAAAQVRIVGAFDGRVRLEMTSALARQLAAQLFGLPEEEVAGELVADAIGELANIIAGNVKALLPDPSRLGLPEPAGAEPAVLVAGAELACGDQSVAVVLERHR
jgi:chemotaxis protein CheX